MKATKKALKACAFPITLVIELVITIINVFKDKK